MESANWKKVIKRSKDHDVTSPDGSHPQVLNEHSTEFAEPLKRTFKSLTETASVPVALKILKRARFWEKNCY